MEFSWGHAKCKSPYLNLIPSPIGPLGVIRHPVCIRESLDPHLDLSSAVKDTAGTIHEVLDRRKAIIIGGIVEDGVIPRIEVRLAGDEARKGLPFIGGSE
jgi:hypothetical protein